jgi:DNA primase
VSRERLRARADRVNQEADLGEMLAEWGYAVVPDRQREQQFSCDLHGPDNKPSARYYGPSNSTYCWVCQKTRDPIAWMMEKEFFGFREAVEELESRCGFESLPWSDEHERVVTPEDEIGEATRRAAGSYEDERDRLRRFLDTLTTERELNAQRMLAFWEAFDRVEYGVAKEGWEQRKGISALSALRERVLEALREAEG